MGDVITTLFQLAFVATILSVALEQIFDTRLYQKYLGKGLDGKGSRFFKRFELRPWIATAVGMFLAFGFEIQALKSGMGLEESTQYLGSEAKMVDLFLTGLIIGGGTKTIVKIAKQFYSTRKKIQESANQ